MEQDFKPMVASSCINVEPTEIPGPPWMIVRPGREQRPIFEGAMDEVITCATAHLKSDGGGVIRVLTRDHQIAEEMRVSPQGDVVEHRKYDLSPQLHAEPSPAGSDTTIIELTAVEVNAPEEEIPYSMYLVLDHKRNEVLAALDGSEGLEGVRRVGFDAHEPSVSLHVPKKVLDRCECEWGPISSAGIERKARDLCQKQSMSLEDLANDARFGTSPESDRSLAAALWVLWEHQLLPHEIRMLDGKAARISRFVLWIDRQGFVTFERCRSDHAACGVMRDLADRQYSQRVDSLVEGVFDPSAAQMH